MTTLAYILLGLLGVVSLIAVVWRGASRRRSLPCPTWLSRLVELDNPFTETNRAAVIVERLELQPGMAVVDVGCGPGGWPSRSRARSGRRAKSWRSIFNPGCCGGRRRKRGPQRSRTFDSSKPPWGRANSCAIGLAARYSSRCLAKFPIGD